MTVASPPDGPDRGQMFRNIGLSLVLNAAVPYVVYRLTAPHYPHDSVIPLLYSTIVPALWLAYGTLRQRSVDAIAIIAICEVVVTVAVTLLASSVSWALIARALQGALVGLVFAGSAAIGRPIIYYIARQFAVGQNPERAAGFDAAHVADKGRTFTIATLVWAAGLIVLSAIHVTLAVTLDHATYLLVGPIVGIGGNIALLLWSIRFATNRLMQYRTA
jgi:hypothetical protein